MTSCIYSVGQSTQFSSAVVDALSTAIIKPYDRQLVGLNNNSDKLKILLKEAR
jgi:hypothetical protein